MSTVNLAEVYTKFALLGGSTPSLERLVASLVDVHAFTLKQASVTGVLRTPSRHAGLSLGDRACLALAIELDVPAYTVDRNWTRVDVGCPIYCLR